MHNDSAPNGKEDDFHIPMPNGNPHAEQDEESNAGDSQEGTQANSQPITKHIQACSSPQSSNESHPAEHDHHPIMANVSDAEEDTIPVTESNAQAAPSTYLNSYHLATSRQYHGPATQNTIHYLPNQPPLSTLSPYPGIPPWNIPREPLPGPNLAFRHLPVPHVPFPHLPGSSQDYMQKFLSRQPPPLLQRPQYPILQGPIPVPSVADSSNIQNQSYSPAAASIDQSVQGAVAAQYAFYCADRDKYYSPKARYVLEEWYQAHYDEPYADDEVADELSKHSGKTREQVLKWLSNRRNRDGNTKNTVGRRQKSGRKKPYNTKK